MLLRLGPVCSQRAPAPAIRMQIQSVLQSVTGSGMGSTQLVLTQVSSTDWCSGLSARSTALTQLPHWWSVYAIARHRDYGRVPDCVTWPACSLQWPPVRRITRTPRVSLSYSACKQLESSQRVDTALSPRSPLAFQVLSATCACACKCSFKSLPWEQSERHATGWRQKQVGMAMHMAGIRTLGFVDSDAVSN